MFRDIDKGCLHEIAKNWPPPPCLQNVRNPHWLNLHLSMRTPISLETSKFFAPKSEMSQIWRTRPQNVYLLSSDCERPLWMAPYGLAIN